MNTTDASLTHRGRPNPRFLGPSYRFLIAAFGLSLVVACGGQVSTQREAASLASDNSAAASTNASPSPSGSKATIGRLGVRVCVWNQSDRDVRLRWLLVDTADAGDRLPPQTQKCGEGTFAFMPMDLQVEIMFDDNLSTVFNFNNPNFGQPSVLQDPGTHSAMEACGMGDVDMGDWSLGFAQECQDGYDEFTINTYIDRHGYHGMTIERLKDTRWKEFWVKIKR